MGKDCGLFPGCGGRRLLRSTWNKTVTKLAELSSDQGHASQICLTVPATVVSGNTDGTLTTERQAGDYIGDPNAMSVFKQKSALLICVGLLAGGTSAAVRATAQDMYVADYAGSIYKVTPTGTATLFATAPLGVAGMARDSHGNIFVSVYSSNSIYKITPAGVSTQFATGIFGPEEVVIDKHDNIYISSEYGGTVTKVTPTGTVTTLASGFTRPAGLAIAANGNILVGEYTSDRIQQITPTGTVTLYANTGTIEPGTLVFDASGNLYLGDPFHNQIGKITPGGGPATYFASTPQPYGMAFNAAGNLFVANYTSNVIDEISPAGVVTPFITGLGSSTHLFFAPEPSTPEPGSVALFASCAVMSAGVIARRRRRNSN